MATEFVRVVDMSTGAEISMSARRAEYLGEKVQVLDKPAVDQFGQPLPAVPADAREEQGL